MERRSIPREVMLEPKLFGPFTWRKLGYALGGGVLFYFLVFVLPLPRLVSIPIGVGVVILAACLVFLKPYGRPFEEVLIAFLLFLLRPKRRVWSKEQEGRDIQEPLCRFIVLMWYAKIS
ncbi:MAG: PrgI family protein [Candidatus Hadarchaeales archaeon]